MDATPFFNFIQERYRIFLKKQAGEPFPWTDDDILGYYKFTNVFREDDRTTVWFRENVRDYYADHEAIILATTLFRWFNRISTGEAIFNSPTEFPTEDQVKFRWNGVDGTDEYETAWEAYRFTGKSAYLHKAIVEHVGWHGPHVTGAYIIKTPDGMTKLNGVCWALEHFWKDSYPLKIRLTNGEVATRTVGWRQGAELMFNNVVTLQDAWDWIRKFSYLGDFMAYEIVSDLRWTMVLDRAPDINTWANAGPGAMRGLNRLHGRRLNFGQKKEKWNKEMQEILQLSRDPQNWPHQNRPLEMREVEHSLCEFDKYCRVDNGEGKPRGVYKPQRNEK